MLKFGRLVDLEKLEKIGINRSADEFREKMAREESKRLKEAFKIDVIHIYIYSRLKFLYLDKN